MERVKLNLAKQWAISLAFLSTCLTNQFWMLDRIVLISLTRRPVELQDSLDFLMELITMRESLSRITCWRPNSTHKEAALKVAAASPRRGSGKRRIEEQRVVVILPSQSLITTPIPTLQFAYPIIQQSCNSNILLSCIGFKHWKGRSQR